MPRTLAVVIAFLLGFAAAAEEFHDATNQFTVTIPAGWKPISSTAINAMDAKRHSAHPKSETHFVAGFAKNPKDLSKGPFVLVGTVPLDLQGLTWMEVENRLGMDTAESDAQGVIARSGGNPDSLQLTNARVDRGAGRTYADVKLRLPNGISLRGTNVGYVGTRTYIQLNCFANELQFQEAQGDFNTLIESFTFDPGAAFVPTSPSMRFWSSSFGTGTIVAGIVGIAGLVVYFIKRR